MTWKRILLTLAYRRASEHHRRATHLYRELASREGNARIRALLQMLGRDADQRVRSYVLGLNLLHAPVLDDQDTMLDRAWRGLLVRCGIRVVLAWLTWDEKFHALLFEVLVKTEPGFWLK